MASRLVKKTRQTATKFRGTVGYQGEQPAARKLARQSVNKAKKAAAQGSSKGRITATERKSIKRGKAAVRMVSTKGEAAGYGKILRKKARQS